MSVTVISPLAGRVIALSEVPDPVFAGEMIGKGIAIVPRDGGVHDVLAPCGGRIVKIHPHAFVIDSPGGPSVLVHVGIDTVSLKGAGFTPLRVQGDEVEAGDPLLVWDVSVAATAGLSTAVPILVLDGTSGAVRSLVTPPAEVRAGTPLLETT